jgi:hypothetical protein
VEVTGNSGKTLAYYVFFPFAAHYKSIMLYSTGPFTIIFFTAVINAAVFKVGAFGIFNLC